MAGRHTEARHFRVLFVCTANRCRSPMAEFLFRDTLQRAWGAAADEWSISSAGVRTRGGHPMDNKAVATLGEYGIDGSDFRNHSLTARQVHEADLILTASREHRASVAALSPAALGRLFTIRQFGRLISSIDRLEPSNPISTGLTLPAAAIAARAQVHARPDEDDLDDPIGGPMARFRECAALLADQFDQIADALPLYRPVET